MHRRKLFEGERKMSASPPGRKSWSLSEAISKWENWTRRRRAFGELSQLKCCADTEMERIGDVLGVSPAEIHKLVSRGPEAANLLLRRMAALDLDRDKVSQLEPQTFHNLQKNCALCDSRRQCVGDLARDPSGPAWQNYCPNVDTLMALNALPWMSRRE
jgi:uncharacterized protein YjiS (DUF1127 family)